MKTYRVEFTPAARQDMFDAARYIAAHAPDAARAWYAGMLETLMGLSEMPRRFAYARENDAFPDTELRQAVYKSHRAVYTVHDELRLVLIHRVWHVARDNAGAGDLTEIEPGGS